MHRSTAVAVVAVFFVLAWFAFPNYRPDAAGQVRVEIPNAAKAETQKWQYDVIAIGTTDVVGGGKNELNRRGKDGWELCGISLDPQFKQAFLILKRPLQ